MDSIPQPLRAMKKKTFVQRLLKNDGIIRNRSKIEAAITIATMVLEMQGEFGPLEAHIWQFTGSKPVQHRFKRLAECQVISISD